MRAVLLGSLLALLVAPAAVAQPGAAQPGPVPLDGIVAVVGTRPILRSEVNSHARDLVQQETGQRATDAAVQAIWKTALEEIVNDEVEVNAAIVAKMEVPQEDVDGRVDSYLRQVRAQVGGTEADFQTALKDAGYESLDVFREEQEILMRRGMLIEKFRQKAQQDGTIPVVAVSDSAVTAAMRTLAPVPPRPPSVAFRQIIIATRAGDPARAVARAKAESLLVAIRGGADFGELARKESMDTGTAVNGGSLGPRRRAETDPATGQQLLPVFENVIFGLNVGQVSPVFETLYGFHIAKVDKVEPGVVYARHILIRPKTFVTDAAIARLRADTVVTKLRAGVPYDTIVAQYHDPIEWRTFPDLSPVESFTPPYRAAFAGLKAGDVSEPFQITDPNTGDPKFVVIAMAKVDSGGPVPEAEIRTRVGEQLGEIQAHQRFVDRLRRDTYVWIRPES